MAETLHSAAVKQLPPSTLLLICSRHSHTRLNSQFTSLFFRKETDQSSETTLEIPEDLFSVESQIVHACGIHGKAF